MNERMAKTLMGLLCLSVAMPSVAQALADPTRPPNAAGAPVDVSGSAASSPVLQSILLSPNRRLALIDGRTVQVGDRVGDARVVAIDVDSVKLRGGGGVTVMKLLPEVRKSRSKSTTSSAEPRPRGDVR